MNLKESFRYQKFLDSLMRSARCSIQNREHSLTVTRNHMRRKANPDAEDMTEILETSDPFFPNDDVIRFMQWLVQEKQKLSEAIGEAKKASSFDIDAAIETNKFRQELHSGVKAMLRCNASRRMDQARDFKFDVNGVQAPYIYDVEVIYTEAFDRKASQKAMRSAIAEADRVSAQIDEALINIRVNYEPRFDVNESFEDVMSVFIEEHT